MYVALNLYENAMRVSKHIDYHQFMSQMHKAIFTLNEKWEGAVS